MRCAKFVIEIGQAVLEKRSKCKKKKVTDGRRTKCDSAQVRYKKKDVDF